MPGSKPTRRAIRQNQPESRPISQNLPSPRLNFSACHFSQEHRPQGPARQRGVLVEHKGQWHIPFFREHRLRCQQVATSHRAKSAANVPRVILICTLLYSAIMTECKRPESIRYSVRLSHAQSERLTTLRDQLHARSNNDVFDYMVTVCSTRRDDLEHLVYSLFGDLAESLAHRFRSLETLSLLHPASTDSYIKCP